MDIFLFMFPVLLYPSPQDLNECELLNEYDLVDSPCDETHSTCTDLQPYFRCDCVFPWIHDIDMLGCSGRSIDHS